MTNKYLFGLTRKQCGVIYSASKKGSINLTQEMISFLYNKVCDFRMYATDATSDTRNKMSYMTDTLNAIFDNDYKKAQEYFEKAYAIETK
ncbi:MAG TPA: hypothetical protein VFD00_07760 [Thermoclostridium sp.]|nr:hypothetical protein [Thermoclostridium sp.]